MRRHNTLGPGELPDALFREHGTRAFSGEFSGVFSGAFSGAFRARSRPGRTQRRGVLCELRQLHEDLVEVCELPELVLVACAAASQLMLGPSDPAEEGLSASAMARPADAPPERGI